MSDKLSEAQVRAAALEEAAEIIDSHVANLSEYTSPNDAWVNNAVKCRDAIRRLANVPANQPSEKQVLKFLSERGLAVTSIEALKKLASKVQLVQEIRRDILEEASRYLKNVENRRKWCKVVADEFKIAAGGIYYSAGDELHALALAGPEPVLMKFDELYFSLVGRDLNGCSPVLVDVVKQGNEIWNKGFEEAHDLLPCGHSRGDYRDKDYIPGKPETYGGNEVCIGCEREAEIRRAHAQNICPDCKHSLKDNEHGFDQNDGQMIGNLLVHSGKCTYCRICARGEA